MGWPLFFGGRRGYALFLFLGEEEFFVRDGDEILA